jgi:hypothetical protein
MLGSISRGLLDPEHEKDTKLDYQEMVDPKVTQTPQMIINALGSLP